jgi:O-antigen ligase
MVTGLSQPADLRTTTRSLPSNATALAISLLLVVATVSWRKRVYYSGGVDPVVAAKALLSVIALALAFVAARRVPRPRPVGVHTVLLLFGYAALATFGAWSTGNVTASAVLAVRLLLLGTTVVLLVRTFPAFTVVRSVMMSMLIVAAVGVITGFNTAPSGRLIGAVPPLTPNEIAMLCSIPAIGIGWLLFTGRGTPKLGWLFLGILVVIWLTGSRAALAALVVALVVMLVQARRLRPSVAFVLTCGAAAIAYSLIATDIIAGFFNRGGSQNVATLSSRTIAWSAAFNFAETPWTRWFGAGLATKRIPVRGQYWDEQLLDSSWISALVQAGRIGVIVLGAWVLSTAVASLRAGREDRMILTGLLVFLVLRSILESGLLDSMPPFIMFMLISLLSDHTTRRSEVPETRWPRGRPSGHPL